MKLNELLKKLFDIDQHTINGATLFGVGLMVISLRNEFKTSEFSFWFMVIGGYFFLILGIIEFFRGVKEQYEKK